MKSARSRAISRFLAVLGVLVAGFTAHADGEDPLHENDSLFPAAIRADAGEEWRVRYLDWERDFLRGVLGTDWAVVEALAAACCADEPGWIDHIALRVSLTHDFAGGGLAIFAQTDLPALTGNAVWRARHALALLDAGDTHGAEEKLAGLATTGEDCPPRCAGMAAVRISMASLAFAKANRPESRRLALLSLDELAQARRHEWAASVALLDDLAELFIALSDTDAAQHARTLAAQRLKTALPPAHPYALRHALSEYAVLANEGETVIAAERMEAMRRDFGDALDGPGRVRVYLGLGGGAAGFMRAEYEAGIAAALSAMKELRLRRGAGAPAIAEALNIIALNLTSLDRNDEAIARYREALAIREAAFAPSHPLIAELANNLSVVFHNIGRYDLAEVYISRTLKIDRAFFGEDNPEVATDLSNLAAIHRSMGDPEGAIGLLLQAVDINTRTLGRRHRRTAIMYHGLGQAYLERGDFQLALDAFDTCVEIHRSIDTSSRNIPIARHNLAKAAMHLGRNALARDTLNEVLVRYREIYGGYHRHLAAAYRDLAQAQTGLADVSGTDESLTIAAGIIASADAPEVQWRVFMALGGQEKRLAHDAAAIFFAKMGLRVLQQMRASQTTLGRSLQRAFARQRSDSYRMVVAWLVDDGRLLEAQRIHAMLKDEEYYDFTRRQRFDTGNSVPFTRFEIRQRDRLDAARERARDSESKAIGFDRYRETLIQVRAELAGLAAHSGAAAMAIDIETPPPPARTAFLYYVVGEKSTRVIVTTPRGHTSALVDIGRAELARRVLAFRERLTDPASDVRPAARDLYAMLIAPVAETLRAERVESLWLRLDDTLRYLPFAALHDGDGYLAGRFDIALMQDAAPRQTARPAHGDTVAAFALTRAIGGFRALPAAAGEAERIVRRNADDPNGAFPGRVWLDQDFDRQALQGALDGHYNMVHLASHFEFSPGNEKDSFLLLGNGERITLYDLRTGDFVLDGIDLLTMSGCNTALSSRDADGREIDGFATTAGRKGAANILATLWPVDDTATANFMTRFYQLHAEGQTIRAALRATQASFADEHPFYWAPFILWSTPES